jgi:hypothetical protein
LVQWRPLILTTRAGRNVNSDPGRAAHSCTEAAPQLKQKVPREPGAARYLSGPGLAAARRLRRARRRDLGDTIEAVIDASGASTCGLRTSRPMGRENPFASLDPTPASALDPIATAKIEDLVTTPWRLRGVCFSNTTPQGFGTRFTALDPAHIYSIIFQGSETAPQPLTFDLWVDNIYFITRLPRAP